MSDQVPSKRHALAAAGLDPDMAMVRTPTYSNEVWIRDDVVIRTAIAARLSADVRYPEIVAAASDEALDLAWWITRRVAGIQLGRAW
jgi:hypothetical protein